MQRLVTRLSLALGLAAAACATQPAAATAPAMAAPPPIAPPPAPAPATATATATAAPSVEARRAQLTALLAEQWEYTLRRSPVLASVIGDRRYNDRWSDVSIEAFAADLAEAQKFLTRFAAIDTTGFPEQEALNQQLMVRGLQEQLDNARFEAWLMPVNQSGGIHIGLPSLVPSLPFATVKDYDDYVVRLTKLPGVLDGSIALMRHGLSKRLVPTTTTEMTAEEIHALGLREVARIEAEQAAIGVRLGFADFAAFKRHVRTNQKLYAKSRAAILAAYRKYTDQMYAKLPELFGRLPRGKMTIEPVEPFREKEASGAQYDQGTPDGARPGMVRVNTYEPTKRLTIDMESTAYHEGVPGHHMQIAIQQELGELPPFRQQGGYVAFQEGWALYSERLGKEVGFYQDPYSDYGRLQDEVLRAIRLVVDTGLHAKRWTREQVVQYFHDHSTIDEPSVQSETDRYIAWPGQALGYKIGQLKISGLRDKAQAALGAAFDLRGFHDEVLGAGALPLDLLERRIDAWIARAAKR
jgi:uncharacterized protein (DUF885 family)